MLHLYSLFATLSGLCMPYNKCNIRNFSEYKIKKLINEFQHEHAWRISYEVCVKTAETTARWNACAEQFGSPVPVNFGILKLNSVYIHNQQCCKFNGRAINLFIFSPRRKKLSVRGSLTYLCLCFIFIIILFTSFPPVASTAWILIYISYLGM